MGKSEKDFVAPTVRGLQNITVSVLNWLHYSAANKSEEQETFSWEAKIAL